jgi:tripartite-type tricarboxylate transporter receptor subunit TctC
MISIRFRRAMIALAVAAMAATAGTAQAQSFPSKPVKLVVGTTAGGLTDTVTRAMAAELTKIWGQPTLVENRPGASTIVAAAYAAKAPADGHTILMANDPTLSSNQYLYSKLPYDPVKDFAPVINVYEAISLFAVRADHPAKSLRQLIAIAKEKPGTINYASFGPGSKTHLDTEAFLQQTGIKMTHIPYKGISEVLTALVGGQIDVGFSGIAPVIPYIRSGQLRALALAGPTRFAGLPDVPTFAESGVPNFESRSWFGLVVPAATPRPVIDRIAADVSKVITRPEFTEKYLTGVGLNLLNQGPDQFAKFLESDRADYAQRVKLVNVKLD